MMTFENHTNALRNIFFFFSFFSLNVSFSQTGCVDINYNFRLETDNLFSVADDITITAGNNIFVSNISTDNTFLITGGLIIQNDKQGNIVWAKRVKYTTDSASIRFDRVKELFNGDLFVMGRSYNASDTLENLLIARF